MRSLFLGLVLLTSFSSFAGPLEDAFRKGRTNEGELVNPKKLSTEALIKQTVKIYYCAEKNIIPCFEVVGDRDYQSKIVLAYISRLEDKQNNESFELTIANALLLKLNNEGEFFDTMIKYCKDYPNMLGCP